MSDTDDTVTIVAQDATENLGETPVEAAADVEAVEAAASEPAAEAPDFFEQAYANRPDTPAVFDPNADLPTEDIAMFDDIIGDSGIDGVSAEDAANLLRQELKSSNFGAMDIRDFTDFNATDYTPDAGEYAFVIEQKYLKDATGTTALTASKTSASFGAVKATIFREKLRLQTFNQAAFSEIIIPLAVPSNVEDGKEVSFVFDQARLQKIAATFPDAAITFTYVADKLLLRIISGETKLELATYPRQDFTEYHTKIGEPQYVTKINPALFREALKYVGGFVRKDDIQNNFSLLEFRNNEALGGTLSAIGVFSSEGLDNVAMRVKYENISILEKMTARFNAENTHLFETDTFYILRDENLYFGFEKSSYSFPPVDNFFKTPRIENVLIPRALLLNALWKLSVVSVDRDLLLNLQVEGNGGDTRLTLTAKDPSGKQSRDIIDAAYRNANDGHTSDFATWDLHINLAALIKTVSGFESANVQFEMLQGKALLVIDEGEAFTARTVLAVTTEEQVAKAKASRDAKAGT